MSHTHTVDYTYVLFLDLNNTLLPEQNNTIEFRKRESFLQLNISSTILTSQTIVIMSIKIMRSTFVLLIIFTMTHYFYKITLESKVK